MSIDIGHVCRNCGEVEDLPELAEVLKALRADNNELMGVKQKLITQLKILVVLFKNYEPSEVVKLQITEAEKLIKEYGKETA